MINAVASHILALPAWLALLVVFVLPAAESAMLVGFVFPGEVALIAGGVLASQGRVPLPAVLVAGVAGAIVGDSIGYVVGRRYGRRAIEGTLGRFVRPHHFDRAETYLAERGGKAVFFGRFTASLRAMIPGLAGMARMPYGKFAFYNVAGGAAWATFTVMVGFVGGSSWQHLAHLASRIGLAALGLFVLAFVGGWLLRRVRAGSDGPVSVGVLWVRLGQALTGSRPGRWVTARFPFQVAWVGRRLDPEGTRGLGTTVWVTLGVACAWTFGGLTEDVVGNDGLAMWDPTVHAWMVEHRTGWLDAVLSAVTWAGSSLVLVPALLAVCVAWWRVRGSWRAPVAAAVVYGLVVSAHAVVAAAVHRARPPAADWLSSASGWSFPSGHSMQVAGFCGAVLLILLRDSTRPVRRVASVLAATLVIVVAASRIYLGVHWLTDVLAGVMLSGAIVCFAAAAGTSWSGHRPEDDPGEVVPDEGGRRLEPTGVTEG